MTLEIKTQYIVQLADNNFVEFRFLRLPMGALCARRLFVATTDSNFV